MSKQIKKRKKKKPDYMTRPAESEEFTYYVRKCGGSSHILLGKRWLDRLVKVTVQEVEE